MDQAESWLPHGALVGTVTFSCAGLGSFTTTLYNRAQGKDRHQLVQIDVRAWVKELHGSQIVGICQQCARTIWEQALDLKISWSKLWQTKSYHMKFLIQFIYDLLPSISILFSWGG